MLVETRRPLLPVESYDVRFVGGGSGSGARTALDILAETLRRQGLDCNTRCDCPALHIRGHAARSLHLSDGHGTDRADLLVVLDEALLERPDASHGLNPDGVLVVASPRAPEAVRRSIRWFGGTVATVDADAISERTGAEPAVALLGGVARTAGFVDVELLGTVTWTAYDRLWPYAAHAATQALDAGFTEVRF